MDLGVGKISLADASGDILKYAQQKLKDAVEKGIVLDVTETKLPALPFEDNSFDAVLFNYVSRTK